MKATGKITVVLFSDTHSNSTVGLLNDKGVELDDEQTVLPSKIQTKFLWKSWLEFVEFVKGTAKGGKLFVVANGDLCDIFNNTASSQTITSNRETVLDLMVANHAALINVSDRTWIVRGTEAHTGLSAQLECKYAADIGAEGNTAHWEVPLDIGGILFEITHHASSSGRSWTRSGNAVRLAADTIIEYAEHRERVPDLVIRGHVHRWNDSGDTFENCRAITLPCWALKTAHVYKIQNASQLPQIGGLVVECQNGKYNLHKFKRYPQRTQPFKA